MTFFSTYPLDVKKEKVEKFWSNRVASGTEDCEHSPLTVEWRDETYDSYEEAFNRLVDEGCASEVVGVAVKFRDIPDFEESPALAETKTRLEETKKKLEELSAVPYTDTVKAAYIGCKQCGSKLSRKVFNGSKCPLCGYDFLSKTTLEQLQALRNRITKLETRVVEETEKCEADRLSKEVDYWLLKVLSV